MKRTLYLKLLVSYLIFAAVIMAVLSFFTQGLMTKNERASEAKALYTEATKIADTYASKMFEDSSNAMALQRQLETIASYNNGQILIVKANGDILLSSADSSYVRNAIDETKYSHLDGFDITDFGNKTYMIGDLYGLYAKDHLIVYATITTSYRVVGYVLITRNAEDVMLSTNAYMNAVFISFAVIFAASFIILGFFTFLVYRPIRKITNAASAYSQGDFSVKIDVNANDEIGYLANTLNYMAEALNTQEEEQRKFISNVSHDFRSPLTSIKGYCEAMCDGTIPVEMQAHYFEIILSETERLNKLTQNLLELNNFGKHELRLDISDFDINAMIKQVIMTFEGICQKREISFDLVLTGQELFVVGDMSKIQQILYNLVDNAIKFSHNDSSIKIETSIKKERVFVSVKDHGIGIPSDSLKKIWERFYKTDKSRGRDKRGVGLGLAIVKEIVTAHKQNIDVISTEGAGTEFIFTLELSEKSKEEL